MSTSLVTPESAVDCATSASSTVSPNSLIRPKLIAFESDSTSMQNQLLLKNVHVKSPSVSPSPTSPSAPSSAFIAEMPQWKKDLIQRRKTNVARNSILASTTDTLTSLSTTTSVNDDHNEHDNDLVEGVTDEESVQTYDVAGEFVQKY